MLFHVLGIERKYLPGAQVLPDSLAGGIVGVDLFFVISGFVIAITTRDLFGHPDRIRRFLYRRAARVYPLYWIYSLLLVGVYLVRPELVNPSQGGRVNIVASFLLIPQQTLPLLMVGWTLVIEISCYVIIALLLLAPRRHFGRLLILWALAVAAGWHLRRMAFPVAAYTPGYLTHPMTLEFIAGCLAAHRLWRQPAPRHGGRWLAGGVALLIVGWAVFGAMVPRPDPNGWLRLAMFGPPSVLVVYGAAALEKRRPIQPPRVLCRVGDASYSLYLSHTLVLQAAGLAWSHLAPHSRLANFGGLALASGMALLVGFASHAWVEKPLARYLRR